MKKKVIIISSYWGNSKHVGNYRIERFIRWLNRMDINIVLVNAGLTDNAIYTQWGKLITVKDPFYRSSRDKDYLSDQFALMKKFFKKLKKILGFFFLVPDSTIIWALRVSGSRLVKDHLNNACLVISSSPPESDHIAALILSRRSNSKLLIDLRDGWLDEPLKPYLKKYAFRRFLERIPEYLVYKNADEIFVTSDEWKSKLAERIPSIQEYLKVITNGYPIIDKLVEIKTTGAKKESISLLYAGRFTGSSGTRKLSILLLPLVHSCAQVDETIELKIIGEFTNEDISDLNEITSSLKSSKLIVSLKNFIPRNDLLDEMFNTDGLLLISTSMFAIPSKIFEYITAKKPILVLCPKESAVWKICKSLPQAFLLDLVVNTEKNEGNNDEIRRFLIECKEKRIEAEIPEKFSEGYIFEKFNKEIDNLITSC